MMAKKIIKTILCLVVAAAIAAAGYYVGYSNHASNIISAIPKQSVTGKETPPGFIGEKGLVQRKDGHNLKHGDDHQKDDDNPGRNGGTTEYPGQMEYLLFYVIHFRFPRRLGCVQRLPGAA